MKFNKETPSNSFQPITVSFTVETAWELQVLKELLCWNDTIPKIGGIHESEPIYDVRKQFVNGLRFALGS